MHFYNLSYEKCLCCITTGDNLARWHPGREHIAYSDEEFNHFVSEYAPAWEETFIAGKTMEDCATEQGVAARL